MSMNVPFAGSHVRPVKAELSGDGGSIEVTVHNHDRAGLDDRAGVTLVAPNGATQSVPAVFDQYLPPTGQGGGASLGSDMWRANIPVSSLSPAMRGVSAVFPIRQETWAPGNRLGRRLNWSCCEPHGGPEAFLSSF
jgi:hypothetical protein